MIKPEAIWSSSQLPTLPSVAVRLLELSKNPDADMREVVQVIKADPAISAKILKTTNSSFYGFNSQITSIERAVPLLGTTVVTSLALTFSLSEASAGSGPLAVHYRNYWRQSVVQGVTAELLGNRLANGTDCELFLAGLLADIGRLAMLKVVGEPYANVLRQAEERRECLQFIERAEIGVDHVEVGVRLMENWKLPASLVHATRLHHAELEALWQLPENVPAGVVHAVALAATVGDYFCLADKGLALQRLRQLAAALFAMSETETEQFLQDVKHRLDEVGSVFLVDSAEYGDPAELLALANEHLAQLAMRAHVASVQATERGKLAVREKELLVTQNLELQRRALHDPLTKVYNRQYLDETLIREVNRCQRAAETIGVIFVDVDHFKKLNDTYGHPFGDAVLQQVAQALSRAVRSTDVLARYGGEEFVVVATQTTEKGLQKVIERLRKAVEDEPIYFGERRVMVTASIGAALGIPGRAEMEFAKQLVSTADQAMYQAKQCGRNRTCFQSLLGEHERQLAAKVLQSRFSRWLVDRQVLDIPTVSQALAETRTEHKLLGELACQYGCMNAGELEAVLAQQKLTNERLGELAIRLGLLTPEQLTNLLAWQSENPRDLAQMLTRHQLLSSADAERLLTEYLSQTPLALATRGR